jgi:hypothetical protein
MSQHKLTERTVVFLAAEQVKRIDDFRFANRYPSEAAAVRKLLDLGLEATARQTQDAAD